MHVERATRELEEALRMARGARKANHRTRARSVEKDLGRALYALSEIGTIAPRYGGQDDPDLMTEDERTRLSRERREQARQQAMATASAATGEDDG